jgi:hypothetical protein
VLELNVAPGVGKRAYDLFVDGIEAITDNSNLCDDILVLDDINLPKIRWMVDEENGCVLLLNRPGK